MTLFEDYIVTSKRDLISTGLAQTAKGPWSQHQKQAGEAKVAQIEKRRSCDGGQLGRKTSHVGIEPPTTRSSLGTEVHNL